MKKKIWGMIFVILVAVCAAGWYVKQSFDKLKLAPHGQPISKEFPTQEEDLFLEEIFTTVSSGTVDAPYFKDNFPINDPRQALIKFRARRAELNASKIDTDEPEVTVNLTSTPRHTELLPTMDSPSKAKNRIWVGTFQLVWNDLIDELVKGPVEYSNKKEKMAELLNKKMFTVTDLSESAYYKKWGRTSQALRKEIEQGIQEKFNETSDILDLLDWNDQTGHVLYAMLKKDFSYIEELTKLDPAPFKGSRGLVKYFGAEENTPLKVKESIGVLFYNSPSDFAIRLTSKQGDEVYLYRSDDDKPLDRLYADMLRKDTHKEDWVGKEDYVKIPMMNFNLMREFTELQGAVKGTDFVIAKAIETAQFKMDEKGVKLKSEAILHMIKGLGGPVIEPRYFYLDDTYAIFINEKGKKPYFAMRVTDAKALQ